MNEHSAPASTESTAAWATRRGTREHNADAVVVRHAADRSVAAAVIDGIGNSRRIAETTRLLAETAARVALRRGVLAGLLSAGELIADPGPDHDEPDAVGVVAITSPGDLARIAWVGDCRAYGWDGHTLRQYSTDHTVGEQLRVNGAPWHIAADHDNWVRTTLALAVVATINTVEIPDPLILLTSDGVPDGVPHDDMTALVRDHHTDPQSLADALVNAARPSDTGYRDDATAAVLTNPQP